MRSQKQETRSYGYGFFWGALEEKTGDTEFWLRVSGTLKGVMVKGFRSALSPVKAVGGGFGFGGLPKG